VVELVLGWTKTQPTGFGGQLACGARAFDTRPAVDKNGTLVFHHGGITVHFPFADALDEVVAWCGANPDELVVMTVWSCEGDGCDGLVASTLAAAGISPVTDCGFFANMTLGGARQRAAGLPGGGQLLVVTGATEGEESCSYSNYEPDVACSGFDTITASAPADLSMAVAGCLAAAGVAETDGALPVDALAPGQAAALISCAAGLAERAAAESAAGGAAEDKDAGGTAGGTADFHALAAGNVSSAVYRCYVGDDREAFPKQRMRSYLDATSQGFAGSPAAATGQLWQMQALWQESAASVVLGTLSRSSLLGDEARSAWNADLAVDVAAGRWSAINLLEVNNVCDGGPQLLDALRAWWSAQRATASAQP